jgi:hypothetical protein
MARERDSNPAEDKVAMAALSAAILETRFFQIPDELANFPRHAATVSL